MLEALPLKEDFEEAQPVYACLVALLSDAGSRSRIQLCLPRLLASLEEVQGPQEIRKLQGRKHTRAHVPPL